MDGPNVNWEVLRKADEMLVGDNYSETGNIGSCSQHTVHCAFEAGTTNDWDVHKILESMFCLLHDSPARGNICDKSWIRCISIEVLLSIYTVIGVLLSVY